MREFKTLDAALKASGEGTRGITYLEGEHHAYSLSYEALYARALGLLHQLQHRGLKPGDELILLTTRNEPFIDAFWAALLGGIVPVPVAPGIADEHRLKLFRVFNTLAHPWLYTEQALLKRLKSFAQANGLDDDFKRLTRRTICLEDITDITVKAKPQALHPDDVAFIQFSSGSTRDPKGVVLTHRNLLTNIGAIIEAARFTEDDVMLSWMPLTHDMGLIGFHLVPVICNMTQHLMPTELFIRRPALWLEMATTYKATILCSPNFGYRHLLKRFAKAPAAFDLSRVRLIFNGAEPISAALVDEFLEAMAPYGLKRTAMFTVYGLAEASLAVSFPELGAPVRTLYLDRQRLNVGDPVRELAPEDKDAVAFVTVGRAIPHCAVRITDAAHQPLPDGMVGHIEIQGANVTQGYYRDAKTNAQAFSPDGWLDTGDLGLVYRDDDIHPGNLVITGRAKEIIFVSGQNYYPHDLERVLEQHAGLELGKGVVAGVARPQGANHAQDVADELLVVFVLFRGALEDFAPQARQIAQLINTHTGLDVAHVVPVKRIPKTTSGKIQRHGLAQAFAQGDFDDVLQEMARLNAAPVSAPDGPSTIERTLKRVVDEALEGKSIGLHDNLFDVGTSSLALVQIHEGIEQTFPGQVDITDLFDHPTIAALAVFIARKQAPSDP